MADGVVLLHGIAGTSWSMRPLQRALAAEGFVVLNLGYRSRHLPLDALAEAIHPAVQRFADTVPGHTHVVGYSMGGLLTRAYLARHRPSRLGRVVMLGTPNGGSEIADRLRGWPLYRVLFGPAGQQLVTVQDPELQASLGAVDYPLGILAGDRPLAPAAAGLMLPGPNDGRVTVARTRLDGAADHLVVPASHRGLVSHPGAIAATLAFLRDGRFGPAQPLEEPRRSSGQRGARLARMRWSVRRCMLRRRAVSETLRPQSS